MPPCYHPISASQHAPGARLRFSFVDGARQLQVPCGQCIGCKLERARQWAMRAQHEASLHSSSYFVTLTYDDQHLPKNQSLNYRDVQLFYKRLRKRCYFRLRHFTAGEYGEQTNRPHYHAIIFGLHLPDLVPAGRGAGNSVLYESAFLTEVWGLGLVRVGEVTFESASYVARYSLKKVTGKAAKDHYGDRSPEFLKASNRPGIGAGWLEKWESDVYRRGHVVVRGRECLPPKYYDKKMAEKDPDLVSGFKAEREAWAKEKAADNTELRLRVRKQVAEARASLYTRDIQ